MAGYSSGNTQHQPCVSKAVPSSPYSGTFSIMSQVAVPTTADTTTNSCVSHLTGAIAWRVSRNRTGVVHLSGDGRLGAKNLVLAFGDQVALCYSSLNGVVDSLLNASNDVAGTIINACRSYATRLIRAINVISKRSLTRCAEKTLGVSGVSRSKWESIVLGNKRNFLFRLRERSVDGRSLIILIGLMALSWIVTQEIWLQVLRKGQNGPLHAPLEPFPCLYPATSCLHDDQGYRGEDVSTKLC